MGVLYSIIVPVYKVEKYLQECIDSLCRQSYKNIEIILVDDGSPDKCGKICDQNAANDKRIRVIHKDNGGVSSARFAGVRAAQGEYVLCVDSDDWIADSCVEKINKVAVDNNYPDVITYGHYRMTIKGNVEIRPTVPAGFYSIEKKREIIFPQLIQNDKAEYYLPGVCGEAFKRVLFLQGMISTREAVIGEDMACTVPCIYHAKSVYVLDECLYYYRFNDASVTKGRKPFPWSCAKVLAKHLEEKMDLSDADFQIQIYRYVVHMLFITASSQFFTNSSIRESRRIIMRNLKDEFYIRAMAECRFKFLSKGWIAHFVLKHRLLGLVWLYNKVR